MKKKEMGCYWGRFNPIHKGHINLIKRLLKQTDKLIIAIGSSQEKNTKRNPFSGEERKQMILSSLEEEKIPLRKYSIIIVNDGKSFRSSVNNLLKKANKFDILFTDKESIINIIKPKILVKRIKRIGNISSTKIRDAIAFDKPWKSFTTKSASKLIIRFNGIKRIKKAYFKHDNRA
jgi:nicotinamide-nucleotide adenylyltransferase